MYELYKGYAIIQGGVSTPEYTGRFVTYRSKEMAELRIPLIATDTIKDATDWIDRRLLAGDYDEGIFTQQDIDELNLQFSQVPLPPGISSTEEWKAAIEYANRPELGNVVAEAVNKYEGYKQSYERGEITPRDFAKQIHDVWVQAVYEIDVLGYQI